MATTAFQALRHLDIAEQELGSDNFLRGGVDTKHMGLHGLQGPLFPLPERREACQSVGQFWDTSVARRRIPAHTAMC